MYPSNPYQFKIFFKKEKKKRSETDTKKENYPQNFLSLLLASNDIAFMYHIRIFLNLDFSLGQNLHRFSLSVGGQCDIGNYQSGIRQQFLVMYIVKSVFVICENICIFPKSHSKMLSYY